MIRNAAAARATIVEKRDRLVRVVRLRDRFVPPSAEIHNILTGAFADKSSTATAAISRREIVAVTPNPAALVMNFTIT